MMAPHSVLKKYLRSHTEEGSPGHEDDTHARPRVTDWSRRSGTNAEADVGERIGSHGHMRSSERQTVALQVTSLKLQPS